MKAKSSPLGESILNAWSTNDRVTTFLVERLPACIVGRCGPRLLRGARSGWSPAISTTRAACGSRLSDSRTVSRCPRPLTGTGSRRSQLIRALKRSGRGIASLLALGLERDGQIPPTAAYAWRNLPLDVGHVLAYFVAHEGHHRGQIVLVARQLGHRLPAM